jgi:hypothetical protein
VTSPNHGLFLPQEGKGKEPGTRMVPDDLMINPLWKNQEKPDIKN